MSPRLSNSRWGWCYVKRAMQNASGSLGMMRRYVYKTTRCPLCFQTDTAMQTTDVLVILDVVAICGVRCYDHVFP